MVIWQIVTEISKETAAFCSEAGGKKFHQNINTYLQYCMASYL
jgi:hypothetical protein